MTEFPETRDSLLAQVCSPSNREAWDQFVQIYRPVIYRLARNRGFQDDDAQDLAQQVLISVASAIGTWEKSSASVRFRHWLRKVARNAIVNALSRRPHDRAVGGSSAQLLFADQPGDTPQSDLEIELEYRRELYLKAALQVRVEVEPDTWRAFELTVIEGTGMDEAALKLKKSIGAIYVARSRVMQRLRETIKGLENRE